jgi:hypothetical protein
MKYRVHDFSINRVGPGLTLELNSGETVWKLVCIFEFKPMSDNSEANNSENI